MYGHKDGVSLHKYKAMVTLIEHQGKPREPNGLWKIVPGCFLEMKKKNVLKLYDGKGCKTLETTQYHRITYFLNRVFHSS